MELKAPSAAYRGYEVAHLVDRVSDALEGVPVIRMILDIACAVGERKCSDAAGRTLQIMHEMEAFACIGIENSVTNKHRLVSECRKHFLFDRAVAKRLAGEMAEVDRTSL